MFSRSGHSKRHLSSPEPGLSSEMVTPLTKRLRNSASINGHSTKSGPEEEEELHEEGIDKNVKST